MIPLESATPAMHDLARKEGVELRDRISGEDELVVQRSETGSEARDRLSGAGADRERAKLFHGDICRVDLARRFDLIVAPYRVFQNLETDEQVDALFAVIRRHLALEGTCILSAFNPNTGREELVSTWRGADPDAEYGRRPELVVRFRA